MAGKFDSLTFITPIIKLISVNVNFPDNVPNDLLSFHQIKIRHIFYNVIWRHFVKLNSHQTFQPYGNYVCSI